jgi:clan AA aspartic protease (TIGR02281 family)
LVAIIGFWVSARYRGGPPPDLKTLYERQQWSELYAAGQVSELPTFYRGAVDSVFNDFASAEPKLLASLEPPPGLEWQRHEARALLIESYARALKYRETLYHIDKGIAELPNWQQPRDARPLYAALAEYPPQSVESHEFARIRWRMKDGGMYVPLELNGRRVEFLADTGASFSIISESEARRLGLSISDFGGTPLTDAAGARIKFRTAVADELKIGNSRIRNVFFAVIGDEMQPFASSAEGERGVIGLPVLVALQRIHWDQAGNFEIGFESPSVKPDRPNLFFRNLRLFAELRSAEGRIASFIDTGMTHSVFLPLFATDYPQIAKRGVKGTGTYRQTGASGSVDVNAIKVPEVRIGIRDVDVTFNEATVQLDQVDPDLRHIHLMLGMDVMSELGPVTLDFVSMDFTVSLPSPPK